VAGVRGSGIDGSALPRKLENAAIVGSVRCGVEKAGGSLSLLCARSASRLRETLRPHTEWVKTATYDFVNKLWQLRNRTDSRKRVGRRADPLATRRALAIGNSAPSPCDREVRAVSGALRSRSNRTRSAGKTTGRDGAAHRYGLSTPVRPPRTIWCPDIREREFDRKLPKRNSRYLTQRQLGKRLVKSGR
jgi:hypothetical protein